MLENDYVMGWTVYLAGCAGLLLVFWRMTRGIKTHWWRSLLRACAAFLLLVPTLADPDQAFLAPALIASLLEGIFQGPDAMSRAGRPLLIVTGCGALLMVILDLGWRKLRGNKSVADAPAPQAQTAADATPVAQGPTAV